MFPLSSASFVLLWFFFHSRRPRGFRSADRADDTARRRRVAGVCVCVCVCVCVQQRKQHGKPTVRNGNGKKEGAKDREKEREKERDFFRAPNRFSRPSFSFAVFLKGGGSTNNKSVSELEHFFFLLRQEHGEGGGRGRRRRRRRRRRRQQQQKWWHTAGPCTERRPVPTETNKGNRRLVGCFFLRFRADFEEEEKKQN